MSLYLYYFSQSRCILILIIVLWTKQYIVSLNDFAPKDRLSFNIYQDDFRKRVVFSFGSSLEMPVCLISFIVLPDTILQAS